MLGPIRSFLSRFKPRSPSLGHAGIVDEGVRWNDLLWPWSQIQDLEVRRESLPGPRLSFHLRAYGKPGRHWLTLGPRASGGPLPAEVTERDLNEILPLVQARLGLVPYIHNGDFFVRKAENQMLDAPIFGCSPPERATPAV